MDLNGLTQTSGEWLRGTGPESDIVISSRIRLARNLADFPFISKATELDRAEIEKSLRERVSEINSQARRTLQPFSDIAFTATRFCEGFSTFLTERP